MIVTRATRHEAIRDTTGHIESNGSRGHLARSTSLRSQSMRPSHKTCGCEHCRDDVDEREREYHQLMNWFMSQLNKEQRRWYAAIESFRIGYRGVVGVRKITGLCSATVARGRREVKAYLAGTPPDGPKGRPGRRPITSVYPDIEQVLETLLTDDIGGDPISGKTWVRRSSRNLSKELKAMGYTVNCHTICSLLKRMGFSLRVNVKQRACTAHSPKRDAQFKYIATQKREVPIDRSARNQR